jgi:hypothetical protein
VERVRGNLASGVLKTAFTSARIQTYSDLVTILLRLGRPAEALEVADAARARALSEHLAAAGREARPFDETARSFADGERLLRRIDLLVGALDEVELGAPGAADPWLAAEAQDRMSRLAAARGEYETLLINLAERQSSTATLLGGVWPSAARIQRALDPREVMLEYMVTPERLIVFVVTSDDIRIAESAVGSEDLATRVRFARELLRAEPAGSAGASDGAGVFASLHRILIEPAARAAALYEAPRLIIVPHDVLTYLPFAALRDGTTGRYMAEDFSLLHLPSAATLAVLRENHRREGAPADGRRGAHVLAPFPDELPATRREAEVVRASLPGAEARIGSEATEGRARQALSQGGVVHLATHGVMNPQNPMFSRLEVDRPMTAGSKSTSCSAWRSMLRSSFSPAVRRGSGPPGPGSSSGERTSRRSRSPSFTPAARTSWRRSGGWRTRARQSSRSCSTPSSSRLRPSMRSRAPSAR